MMRFDWTVTVGGVNVSQWVKAGGTIDYGRRTTATAFQAPTAVFELFTKDENPSPAPSPWPTVRLGDPVLIHVTWNGTVQHRRFTGKVQALDWGLYGLRVTAAGTMVDWQNLWAGWTYDAGMPLPGYPLSYPDQLETVRVSQWVAQAGATCTVEGVPARRVRAVPPNSTGQRLTDAILRIADDCDALLLEDRLGVPRYRTRNFQRPLRWVVPAHLVESTTLDMALERGTLVNSVTVFYGEPDSTTGLQGSVYEKDDPSVTQWGERHEEFYTDIQYEQGARGKAAKYLERNRIQWTVPDVTLVMSQATGADADAVLALEENWRVTLAPLPAGCPISTFDGDILGFTDIMHETDYRLILHLGPPVGDEDEPPEEPIFPADSLTGGTSSTYEDQFGFLWQVHTWETAGDFTATVNHPVTGDCLVVGGGGSGGNGNLSRGGGGGGAGAVFEGELALTAGTVAVTVGAGGVGASGGTSKFAGAWCYGGGKGGNAQANGSAGGCGGGGGQDGAPGAATYGSLDGGVTTNSTLIKGQAGFAGSGRGGFGGGVSYVSSITGTSVTYAVRGEQSPGGTSGAGPAGVTPGSAGGGGGVSSSPGGAGKSGLIAYRYRIG